MTQVVIGLDIGTTSVSCVVIQQDGRLLTSITSPHNAGVADLPSGCAEQNPKVLRQAAFDALRRVMADSPGTTVAALGVTGQMHSTVLLNAANSVIGNVITWQDKRSLKIGLAGQSHLEELRQRAGDIHMQPTGCRLAPGYLGTTLYALKQAGQLPADLHHVSFVADWMVSVLTDQLPTTDRSHAASAGLYNLAQDCWSRPMLEAAEVSMDWLPVVSASGVPVGTVTDTVAEQTGMPVGTPVCNAIGDNQAAVISSLPSDPNSLLINVGTGGQIVWRVDRFRRVVGMDTRYLPTGSDAGGFMLVGAGLCGGDAYAWVNQTIRHWLSDFGVSLSADEIWQRLAVLMAENGNNESLVCEPFFFGTRPEPDRRGVFCGVSADNFTPAGVAHSVLRGIAESMYDVYQHATGHRPEPLRRIVMSGNAARRNPALVAAVAKRFHVPTFVSGCYEEAATGAAMLAGVTVGCWSDLSEAEKCLNRFGTM
ncbi:MAG: FGGY family carbohydrate kinase [Fuerstiella sp.]